MTGTIQVKSCEAALCALAKEMRDRIAPTVIAITGSTGKTTTKNMVAAVLKERYRTHKTDGNQNNLLGVCLTLLSMPADTEMLVVEMGMNHEKEIEALSLLASPDVAVITNLTEDYGIANNTRRASDAKAEVLTDGLNIVKDDELDIWRRYREDGFVTYGGSVVPTDIPGLGGRVPVEIRYKGECHVADLDENYLALQYIPAMDLAVRICESMDIPINDILDAIRTFKGVPGRGEVCRDGTTWRIKDRNPGISHLSIGMTLECLKRMGALDHVVAIVDPVSKKVCDKMKVESMREVADRYGVPMVVTDGMGSVPVIPDDAEVVVEFVKEGYQ
jgi:UDP-N-acetylmuramyl pentapeptide synthase